MAVPLTDELKKEIGQHFIFGFHGSTPFSGKGTDILTLTGPGFWVGNVIFMKRNVVQPNNPESTGVGRAQTIASHIRRLQAHARDSGQEFGLGIGTDQEGGLVSAFSTAGVLTLFPGAMALGSIQDDSQSSSLKSSLDFTEAVYAAQATELNLLGVNWAFAPVGDVNSERENPVIGVRSFGDDPERVAQHVLSSCKGFTRARVSPSVKHFLGHGDTRTDSHLGLPRIYKDWASKPDGSGLEDIELIPFRRLAESLPHDGLRDMTTIMTGHMSVPLVTGKTDEPASLSPAVTTGILRDDTRGLGFTGVIVTDCLEMDAISKTKSDLEREKQGLHVETGIGSNPGPRSSDPSDQGGEWAGGPGIEEGAVLALEAGADIVMICHTFEKQKAAMQQVWAAVSSGRLPLSKLHESSARVKKWKKSLGLEWSQYDVEKRRTSWSEAAWDELKQQNAVLASAAYARAVSCLSPGEPLNAGGKVVVFTPAMTSYNLAVDDAEGVLRTKGGAIRNTAGASFLSFVGRIRKRVGAEPTRHIVFGPNDDIQSLADVYPDEQVIFTLRNADRGRWQLKFFERILSLVKERIVVVSTSTPYDLVGFESSTPGRYMHLACCEYTEPALDAVEKVIFGEQNASGRVPVRLV
ncbi:hypothetical protein D9757_003338 [Collybiopsis confluens]|uniref:Glycoside hydrolase family 3 N-terminal domain-containing protein n=1 Tax=Collybiopsis confluens TaxID=2823264 RepID=A0A8H5HYW0_9AGAR|nr:hypothetical protein D9757_003338 [Collybiopsis confluens]